MDAISQRLISAFRMTKTANKGKKVLPYLAMSVRKIKIWRKVECKQKKGKLNKNESRERLADLFILLNAQHNVKIGSSFRRNTSIKQDSGKGEDLTEELLRKK